MSEHNEYDDLSKAESEGVCENASEDYMKEARATVRKEDMQAMEQVYTKPHNEAMHYKMQFFSALQAKYPYFFHKDMPTTVSLPVGWFQGIEQAFAILAATGMSILISNLEFKNDSICVTVPKKGKKKYFEVSVEMLNEFLKPVSKNCVLCGTTQSSCETIGARRWEDFYTCPQCEKLFKAHKAQPKGTENSRSVAK